MRKFNSLAAMTVAAGLALPMVSPAVAAPEGAPVSGGKIIWGVTTEPSCFDPHRSSQQAAFFVARNYIDSLVGKKSDGTFAPWLATEWSISPDGKEYTFKLREDVVFHDGEKFDAAAVKANFDFVKKPENAATAASLLEYYGGAEIVSPYVVKFVLTRPDSNDRASRNGGRCCRARYRSSTPSRSARYAWWPPRLLRARWSAPATGTADNRCDR